MHVKIKIIWLYTVDIFPFSMSYVTQRLYTWCYKILCALDANDLQWLKEYINYGLGLEAYGLGKK